MKKRVLYILFMRLLSAVFLCLCSYNYMNAQPLWEGLSVDKFYRENKEIYLQRFENGVLYQNGQVIDRDPLDFLYQVTHKSQYHSDLPFGGGAIG
ncbi:MAG: hypothetical protein ACFNUV_03375, partial [Capnocytophaga endodontalis]